QVVLVRLPLLRHIERGGHRAVNALLHDPDSVRLHERHEGKGVGAMTSARGVVGSRIGLKLLLGVILLWTVVPLVWMVASSFKPADELTANPPSFSFKPTLDHYNALFSGGNNIGR